MDWRREISDEELARNLAEGAGAILLAIRQSTGLTGAPLGQLGDAVAQSFLARALAALRPDDALLSEEGVDDLRRLAVSRVWIVDPLDGTREYAEGRADWAVHVALSVDGHVVTGAVSQPDLGATYGDGSRLGPPGDEILRILVSRTRPPPIAEQVARRLGMQLQPMGSAGAKAMAVLRGEAQAYVHSGGQFEWDSAAPVAVAQAAGLHASRLDGSELRYNRPDPYLPDLLICRPEWTDRILTALRSEAVV